MAKGKFSEPRCRKLFKDITRAVAYLHKNGIAHRDLKGENVLLRFNEKVNDSGRQKILYFLGETWQSSNYWLWLRATCGSSNTLINLLWFHSIRASGNSGEHALPSLYLRLLEPGRHFVHYDLRVYALRHEGYKKNDQVPTRKDELLSHAGTDHARHWKSHLVRNFC